MAVNRERESTRPGWGWALVVGLPLLFFGSAASDAGNAGAANFLGLLAIGGIWLCLGNGKTVRNLRAKFTSVGKEATPARRTPPGNLPSAERLAAKLRSGQVIESIRPSFRLREGETQHARFDNVKLYEWFGVDVPYKTIHNRAFHPVGWVIDATVHKAINERNRARAEAEAAATWREVSAGSLYLTSHRLVLDDGLQMRSWWFTSIVGTQNDGDTILLRLEDEAAVLLELSEASVLLVALHHLAWNEIVELPASTG